MEDPNVVASPAPSSADTSVPATPAAATPAVTAQPVATPPVTPGSATPIPDGYVPSHRIRETREAAYRQARAEAAQEAAQYRAEAERYRAQLHSLVGVTPPANPEVETVRQQFAQLYPGLAKLESRYGDIEGFLAKAQDLETQNNHYWTSHGRQTMDRLFQHANEAYGAPLTDDGKRLLHSAFVGYIQSDPSIGERYANDPSLVDEFWRMYSSSFIDPARRAASATVAGRAAVGAALPQDTPSGALRPSPAPAHQSLDERMQAGWAQYQQSKLG